ncbi:MAG TPA: ATP-dependent DNA helicase [Myxococcota bacterium]|nr:ATP-dependent DNA helicase [Myxococcota bacterium]
MALRWNDGQRKLTLSVHDAIDVGPPSGHLRSGAFVSRARLQAGTEAHVAWQGWRKSQDESFAAEVSVKVSVVVRDWECVLRGRIDGLSDVDGRLVVEELKSSALDGDQLGRAQAHDWPAYTAQVALYRYLLHAMGKGNALGRLVLVSLVDGTQVSFEVDEPLEETEAWLRARLSWMVAGREARNAWMARRRGAEVPFPHAELRPGQEALVEAATDGAARGRQVLLSAPTGTGKTAAVLQGVLQEAYRKDKKVFIATAKGTQQRVAEATLELMRKKGLPLRAVSIRAKEKACLNDVVDCRPECCVYADGYFDRVEDAVTSLLNEVVKPEDVRAIGERLRLCPFELSLDLSDHADVVVGDYNYVFHPRSQLSRHFSEDAGEWIVVVDEAHNLPERARDHHSPELRAEDALRAAEALEAEDAALFTAWIRLARETEQAIDDSLHLVEPDRVEPGRVHRGEAVVDLVHRVWLDLRERYEELAVDYLLLRRARPTEDEDLFSQLARSVQDFAAVLEQWRRNGQGEEIASIVKSAPCSVKLVCVDPSPWLRPRFAELHAVVLMSATLSPTRFYVDLCGLDSDRLVESLHPSPFPPENLEVVVAGRISTTYRDRAAHRERTAELITEIVQATPGNVAVFYSSFAMLHAISPEVVVEGRETLLQERRMTEPARLELVDRLRELGAPRTLHAVLGGIFSEGIDLPGGVLKTAVVVGPALPMVGLERDLMRAWMEHRYGDGFGYAFLVPGMSRVVQAAGRLVRGPDDRGCVVLVGRRFAWKDYAAFFPASWAPLRPGRPAEAVEDFWAR